MPAVAKVTEVTANCPKFQQNMFKEEFCTNCQGHKSVCGGHSSNKGKKLVPVADSGSSGGSFNKGGASGGAAKGGSGGGKVSGTIKKSLGGAGAGAGGGGRSMTGNGPDRDPDTGLYCTDDAKFALKKIIEKNMRAVVCTVNGDSGIELVGQPIPFTEDNLAGDLSKARDQCKGVEGLVVVVRPAKEKLTKVYQITTAGMKMRAKMILANASLWVRINGDCYAHGNEIKIDAVEELQASLFTGGGGSGASSSAPPPPPPAEDAAPPPPADSDEEGGATADL